VILAWRVRAARLPGAALAWWLGSVAVFAAGLALFNDLVYGGPDQNFNRSPVAFPQTVTT
jgi:hypothetical protein